MPTRNPLLFPLKRGTGAAVVGKCALESVGAIRESPLRILNVVFYIEGDNPSGPSGHLPLHGEASVRCDVGVHTAGDS